MCGADMEGRPIGSVTYTPLCNANGGVEADVTVTRVGPGRWYMCTGGSTASHDRRWIDEALAMGGFSGATGGVHVHDVSEATTLLSVQVQCEVWKSEV